MKDLAPQSSPLTFSAVPYEVLDVVWADAAPLLAKAVETSGGRYTIDSVYKSISGRHLALWLVMENTTPIAALTTRVVQLPTMRALAVDWLGGTRMKEWLPLITETLKQYAKDSSCAELHGYGRRAWSRWLEPHGWRQDHIVYSMELNDG